MKEPFPEYHQPAQEHEGWTRRDGILSIFEKGWQAVGTPIARSSHPGDSDSPLYPSLRGAATITLRIYCLETSPHHI